MVLQEAAEAAVKVKWKGEEQSESREEGKRKVSWSNKKTINGGERDRRINPK